MKHREDLTSIFGRRDGWMVNREEGGNIRRQFSPIVCLVIKEITILPTSDSTSTANYLSFGPTSSPALTCKALMKVTRSDMLRLIRHLMILWSLQRTFPSTSTSCTVPG
ncbi:hypothetical protein V5799_006401 [Amblyomma americanum]|uniref:Uncharacterized protein n=1 Tax=Amblyomma americanum TaxID=6943 RepID=A0AAQ4DWH6_AMBAM